MAQNITLLGANYSAVPAVQLPKTGGGTATFTDVTDTTAAASDVATGKYFYTANGTRTAGTNSGGGGASSWTKVAENTYTVSTTKTSQTTIETWQTGHNEIYTSDKWLYIRTRDTAGKRDGYFYGADQFYYNNTVVNGTLSSYMVTGYGVYILYSGGAFNCTALLVTNGGYGVYADRIYSNGDVRMRHRYNGTYSMTIDGTYKVEVYLLDPAGGVPIFE